MSPRRSLPWMLDTPFAKTNCWTSVRSPPRSLNRSCRVCTPVWNPLSTPSRDKPSLIMPKPLSAACGRTWHAKTSHRSPIMLGKTAWGCKASSAGPTGTMPPCDRRCLTTLARNGDQAMACWCAIPRRCQHPVASRWAWPDSGVAAWGKSTTVKSPSPWARAIQFSIFPSLPESSTPSPLAGGEGWDGGEKHGLGTPPACTPTLALPLAQGEGKDRQARVRKLNGPVVLHRYIAWLLEEAPTQCPSLLGQGHEVLIVFYCTALLALPAGGEKRFFEVPPAILDRMAMVGLKSGMRKDRFDGFGEALGVSRAGRGHMEAQVFDVLQTLPGIVPILRHRFMGDQDAGMLILHHHHTMVRTHRGGAVKMTLRRRSEGKQVPKHLLWWGSMRANSIHPAFDRRLGHGNQEQHGKEQRNVPEADSADHGEVAGEPDHAVAHRLGGRDTLDCRCAIHPLVMGMHLGTLRDDEAVGHRMVERRQCMHIDVVGVLAPPERGLRPQLRVKVVLAQITLDHCRAVFHRRADKGVLIHLRDRRRQLHLHGHRPVPPFATADVLWDTWRRGEQQAVLMDKRLHIPARIHLPSSPLEVGSSLSRRG